MDNNNGIRKATADDYHFLKEMLFASIHVPPGAEVPPPSIIDLPELQYYIRGWMKESDAGFIAELRGRKVGATWTRVAGVTNQGGYGFIDPAIPELCFAVKEGYRNRGLGTALMQALFNELRVKGYQKLSLSVSKSNQAVRLYKRLGFELYKEQENDYLMLKKL